MSYFGTDGIRDRVDGPLLAPAFVRRLGRAIGIWLKENPRPARPHVLIGRDTRASGKPLFLELCRGLAQEGIRIMDGGICPTPAVARGVLTLDLDLGIVLTASHNPASDNGIKLFNDRGTKLTPEEESAIEDILDGLQDGDTEALSAPAVQIYDARRHYIEDMQGLLGEGQLQGLRIVLDTANGATFQTSGEVLAAGGAQVLSIGHQPDGENINSGVGSEHPERLGAEVVACEADLGIAHDGDGDRLILCDHKGRIIDGDAILAVLGKGWKAAGELEPPVVVATIMSNLGLDHCLQACGVKLLRSGVGDRHVYYLMEQNKALLGGESSGHFIARPYLPTGDGLLAALLFLREMSRQSASAQSLASSFTPFPQLTRNLKVKAKPPLESLPDLTSALKTVEADLSGKGRVLVRYSGTESKIRLLSEAEDASLARATMDDLETLIRQHLPVAEPT